MAAISYSLTLGAPLESVVASGNPPAAGQIQLAFDQTATTVTDAAAPGGTRALKRGEVFVMLEILRQKLIADPNVFD